MNVTSPRIPARGSMIIGRQAALDCLRFACEERREDRRGGMKQLAWLSPPEKGSATGIGTGNLPRRLEVGARAHRNIMISRLGPAIAGFGAVEALLDGLGGRA